MKKRSDTNPSPRNLYTTFTCKYLQKHKLKGTENTDIPNTKNKMYRSQQSHCIITVFRH